MTTISIAVTITVEAPSVHTGGSAAPTAPMTLAGVRDVILGALTAAEDVPVEVVPEPKPKPRRVKKPTPPLPEPEPLPPPRDVYTSADAGSDILVERIGEDYHWICWWGEQFCTQSTRGWARPQSARVAGGFHLIEAHGRGMK